MAAVNVDKMRHQLRRDHRPRVFDGGEFVFGGDWRPSMLAPVTTPFRDRLVLGRYADWREALGISSSITDVGDSQGIDCVLPVPEVLRVQVQVGATGGACVFPTIDGGLTVNSGETVNLHREGDRWVVDGKVAS